MKTRKMKISKLLGVLLASSLFLSCISVHAGTQTIKSVASLKNSAYPCTEGFTVCDGVPFVLKTKSSTSTECQLGTITNGVASWKKQNKTKLGHGNDMTYNTADHFIYVAPGDVSSADSKFVRKMSKNGDVNEIKLKTDFAVGAIAYSKTQNKFILKEANGKNKYHAGVFKNNAFCEEYSFTVKVKDGNKHNQGICLKDGYLYITSYNNNKSIIYKTKIQFKNFKKGSEIDIAEYATITPQSIKSACVELGMPSSGNIKNVEVESLAFNGNKLQFSANINYYKPSATTTSGFDGVFSISN